MVIDTRASVALSGVDPRDFVVGVLDDAADAVRAVQRLHEAGFDDTDVVVVGGKADVPERLSGAPERRFVNRLFAGLKALSDPGAFQQRYLQQLSLGHSILHVYAPSGTRFERAVTVLEQAHAHVP